MFGSRWTILWFLWKVVITVNCQLVPIDSEIYFRAKEDDHVKALPKY